MARRTARPKPEGELRPLRRQCPACGGRLSYRYDNRRTVMTLRGLVRLRLKIHRCETTTCPRYHRPYRPEGAMVLPQHEFGLDVIAWIGALRYQQHRSVPEIHRTLCGRGITVCERTVTNLLDRYDELLAAGLTDSGRLHEALSPQGRVILALDGLQPDVGHEVVRDCLSGPLLLVRSLLSATADDLATLITAVAETVGVPIVGVVSDGQRGWPWRRRCRVCHISPAHLRGRPPCQEGTQEAGARRPADRAGRDDPAAQVGGGGAERSDRR